MSATLTSPLTHDRHISLVWSSIGLIALAIIGAIVHSYNMFGFPLYLGDEGIYMSQAYAVARMGTLTPYTYWYDHAPAGWILIALWTVFSGGFQTFGTAIDSGRVLMLILHIASLMLVYRIVLRLSNNIWAALTAGLLFTLSPLAVMYGRMVLLDNIMIFWALLALTLYLEHQGRIWYVVGSGFCFGVAVLTKEIAFILLPAFLFGIWKLVDTRNASFARAGWLFAAIGTMSLYALYASLRKELFDFSLSSPLTGASESSVTLFGSFLWQLSRNGGAPWDPNSDFYRLLTENWLVQDAWLLMIGLVASSWNLIAGPTPRRLLALTTLLTGLGIARGGVVLEFYILAMLPFLAMNIGLALADIARRSKNMQLMPVAVVLAMAIGYTNLASQRAMFELDMTSIQREALSWIRNHVPTDAQLVIDDDLWVDLRDGGHAYPSYAGAHSHWKIAADPAVYRSLFYEDWRNLDYIVLTPGMDEILLRDPATLTSQAYTNSTAIQRYSIGSATVEIRRIDNPGIATTQMVMETYARFRDHFMEDGQVRAPGGYNRAADQAAAMLMAVWMDDKASFDELWGWAYMNLRSSETGLFYESNAPGAQASSMTAADTDMAVALLLAQRRWNDASYGRYGSAIAQAIWEHSVVEIDGVPYLAAGDWAVSDDQVLFTPAAFAPYAYYLFAEADPDNNWWYLLDSGYRLLNRITEDGARLPPTYIGIDRSDGKLIRNPAGATPQSDLFTSQAAEVYWRVGLEAQWHEDPRADAFLTSSDVLLTEWQTHGMLAATYANDATAPRGTARIDTYAMVLPKFMVEDEKTAHTLYATQFASTLQRTDDGLYWNDGNNIDQQRWAWLATGLYAGMLDFEWAESR